MEFFKKDPLKTLFSFCLALIISDFKQGKCCVIRVFYMNERILDASASVQNSQTESLPGN